VDFAGMLISKARTLYADESFGIELGHAAYALDTTTIDLCLTLFPWAQFRRHKSAVNLHTLMDLRGSIPCFVCITSGSVRDVSMLDKVPVEPGAFYIMDRGYTDFTKLYAFTEGMAFFIIRARANLDYSRISYRTVDKTAGLRSDQTITLQGPKTSLNYPMPLRRIGYYDATNDRKFVFLTNNFMLDAMVIAQLYKCRWQIELFFKWIKQHLHIKAFFGTLQNAVKTQIWIAVSIYVLIAIIKKELQLDRSLAEILQILSISLFEKVQLPQALTDIQTQSDISKNSNQLSLFNL
jgi:transposase